MDSSDLLDLNGEDVDALHTTMVPSSAMGGAGIINPQSVPRLPERRMGTCLQQNAYIVNDVHHRQQLNQGASHNMPQSAWSVTGVVPMQPVPGMYPQIEHVLHATSLSPSTVVSQERVSTLTPAPLVGDRILDASGLGVGMFGNGSSMYLPGQQPQAERGAPFAGTNTTVSSMGISDRIRSGIS